MRRWLLIPWVLLVLMAGCGTTPKPGGEDGSSARQSGPSPAGASGSSGSPAGATAVLPPLKVKPSGWEFDLDGAAGGPERAAVLVAAGKYRYEPTRMDLAAAENDVKRLEADLVQYAGFQKQDIEIVKDNDVTRDRVGDAVARQAARLKGSGSLLFFYYTGHGCTLDGKRRAFLTHDSRIQADGTPTSLFTEDDVQKWLSDAKREASVATVALFDCCYVARGKSETIALQAPTAWNPTPLKVADVVVSACSPLEAAWPTSDAKMSLFTAKFCDALSLLSRQSAASLEQVFQKAREDTIRDRSQQTPTMENALAEVPFLGRANLRARIVAYDGVTGAPLSGVTARWLDQPVTLPHTATRLTAGDYPLQVEAPGYFRAFETVKLKSEDSGKRYCVRLLPLYAIVQGVTRNPDGTAPVGAEVRLLGSPGAMIEGYHQAAARVAAGGEFALRVAPDSRYLHAAVQLSGGASVRIDLPSRAIERSDQGRRVMVYDLGVTTLPAKAAIASDLAFQSEDGRMLYTQAREYEAAGQFDLAMVNYRGARRYVGSPAATAALDERMIALYERQANKLFAEQQWKQCRDWCDAGLKEFPKAETVRELRKRAEEEDIPESVRSLWRTGMTAMSDGDLDAAETAFERGFPEANYYYKDLMAKNLKFLYGELFKKHFALANQYFRSEEWKKSAESLARCLKCRPDFPGLDALKQVLLTKPEVSSEPVLRRRLENPDKVVEGHGGGFFGAKEMTLDLGGGVTMKLVLIPPGEFMMGSPEGESGREGDEGPQHRVRITKPFYMGIHEVTQAQYQAVMGRNPSHFSGQNNPVEMVSWNDATEFCRKLSQKAGVEVRLPTEAEWEYACRAGTTTRFWSGDHDGDLDEVAWYYGNSGSKTHPVGGKKPNAWGLYDMHGNVWEWCADWYGENYYRDSPKDDPTGPQYGGGRVRRGGSWYGYPRICRSADRYRDEPTLVVDTLGFRVAVSRDSK